MFERHREKKAAEQHQRELDDWRARREDTERALEVATGFAGERESELVLRGDEAVFYTVQGASLVEERQRGGHYQGGSTGVSIPVGSLGGRSIRYRVGASRGHWVQGTPTPAAVDTGALYVTDRRVVFVGTRQTRECDFAKLLAVHHDDGEGTTTLSVSNRKTPLTFHYGPALSGAFDFRLELALAHFRGTEPELLARLGADLAALDAARPVAPPT